MSADVFMPEDFRSLTWRKVKEYAEEKLRVARINLESDASPERTAKLRGEIRSLVLLLALETTPAPAEVEEDTE